MEPSILLASLLNFLIMGSQCWEAIFKKKGPYRNIDWLVVWNIFLFFHTLGTIVPTDFHIFQRGRYTTNQLKIIPRKLPSKVCHQRCFAGKFHEQKSR